eukprot:scaffold71048_cov55-Attheya_sp.AAC.4
MFRISIDSLQQMIICYRSNWVCVSFSSGIPSIERRLKCGKLESIGFVFVCPPSGLPWDERFKELVDFKAINGHTNVPDGSGPLGTWAHIQRQKFRRLKEGKHSTLTIERWKKLESIGFEFHFNVRKTALEICKNSQGKCSFSWHAKSNASLLFSDRSEDG